jgi:hypothetical protein
VTGAPDAPPLARALRAVLVPLVLLAVASAPAQDEIERQGYFDVRSASTTVNEGVVYLDARLQLVLSDDALAALENGVPLTIELMLEVIRERRFLPDPADATLALRYQLEYKPLSQRYIVSNLNSGEQDSFATLYSALNNLGRIQHLPVLDVSILDDDEDYRMRLQAVLSTHQYPAPLRLLFFWRDDWQLKSEWYEWSLER